MALNNKAFRYYYWLVLEFIKKHLKLIILSFLVSFVFLIGIISLSPFIEQSLSSRNETIGLVGKYSLDNLPEEITTKISNGLIFINEKGAMIPALASSWELVEGNKEYRFHLRNNLIWSNGAKFTTKDIDYKFIDIEKKIIDDKTIHYIFKKPLATFPNYLRKPIIKYPLIGVAGLYKTDKIKSRYDIIREISLVPNKKNLPSLKYIFYDNETQLINAYKKGEVNQINTSKKSIADVFYLWKNSRIEKNVDYTRLLTIFFDLSNPNIKQKEIRQALLMAINKQKLTEFGELAVGPIPPISWAYNPQIKDYLYQKEIADKILKKSFSSTLEATIKLTTYYDYADYADQIASFIKDAGLDINVNFITYDKPSNFDLLLAYWKVPNDPDQYYFWHSLQNQSNIGNYKNVRVDKLLEIGRDTISTDERKKIYFEFQKIVHDDPPAIFLFYPYIYTIKRK